MSGETLVRNLALGLATAAGYGGAMEVGYLPDMFGHVAQMPQLLAQFGFEHAAVWRGVPAAVDRSAFWWSAPDGSTVRAEYLPEGYGNGASMPDDPARLVERVAGFSALHGELLTGPILWMNGADHAAPRPALGQVVARANREQDAYRFDVVSLADHLAGAAVHGLPAWAGELRSGARANLLMGVASNRVDVKQAAARAELALERLAEPLSALLLPAERWPRRLFDEAWLGVIRNAAHDSVCACSVDEVCDAVLHRYAEATQIADGLTRRALDALGARLRTGPGGAGPDGTGPDGASPDQAEPFVVNPSARPRHGVVELWLAGEGAPPGVQVLSSRPRQEVVFRGPPATAAVAVQELEWQPIDAVVVQDAEGTELLRAGRGADGVLVDASMRRRLVELAARLGGREHLAVRVAQPPGQAVLAFAADVPGYGWARWAPGPPPVDPVVAVDARSLANGLLTVAVDPATGTFSVDGHGGLGRLVDGGDIGDTYNWCPPDLDLEIGAPASVTVGFTERGPLRGRLVVAAAYRWPRRAEHGRRSRELVDVAVTTTVELRAGERFVRVATAFDHHCRDHRLRALFPLPSPAAASRAECAFGTVTRTLVAEGGPTEAALATFPSRRFVSAGGLTVVHEGLLEYELVQRRADGAHALALTLVRATGMLSRGPMATRALPAGPLLAMEGPQLQGPLAVRYAVHVGDDVDPYALADDVLVPLQTTYAGAGHRRAGQLLAVGGAEVSALRRAAGGELEVRVFNPSDTPSTVTIADRSGWLVDLRGRRLGAFEGSFELGPWRIATALLTDTPNLLTHTPNLRR